MSRIARAAAALAVAVAAPLAATTAAQALPNTGGTMFGCYHPEQRTYYPNGATAFIGGHLYRCWMGGWEPVFKPIGSTGTYAPAVTAGSATAW